MVEAECSQEAHQLGSSNLIDREFKKLYTVQGGNCGQCSTARGIRLGQYQRTKAITGDEAGRGCAKIVVEYFQRQRSAVARSEYRAQEICHVQLALSGEIAEMAAPAQHIHRQPGRVRQLHEEQLL